MNLVVHQFLSCDNPEWMAGNHLGEVVKGKMYLNYPPEIQKGILLHRFIDTFSDAHPVVKRSSHALHKNYGKFSPIIIDVYYDFLLIKNWEQFSDISFMAFRDRCYSVLKEFNEIYPEKLKVFTEALFRYDWFNAYSTYEGLEVILGNMSRRTKFHNNMNMAVKDLYLNESAFEQNFLEFFPDLLHNSRKFLGLSSL